MSAFVIFLLLPTYLIRFSLLGVPSTLLEIIIWAVVIVTAIRHRWGIAQLRALGRPSLLGMAGLLLAGVVSLAVSPDLRAGLGLFKGFIVDPLLVLVILRLCDYAKWPELPWRGYNISALVLAGWGLIQWAAAHQMSYRAAGPFESPNYLAFYLVPAAMYVIYRVITNRSLQRLLATCELVIILGGLYVTDSRGGALALVAGLVVWAVWFAQRRVAGRVVGLGLGVAGAAIAYGAINVGAARLTTSDDIRRIVWGHATALAEAHPILGVGLGGFHLTYSATFPQSVDVGHRVARDVSNAHNLYFTLWLNLGLLGLLSILWFVAISARKAWSVRHEPLVWAGLAALASILAHGLVDTPVWKNDLFPIFWLAVATPWLIPTKAKGSKKAAQ